VHRNVKPASGPARELELLKRTTKAIVKSKPESILHLNLTAEFFGKIAAKTKRIEYRDRKPHWTNRLEGRHYDLIQFRNGYAKKAPEMLVQFRGLRRYGNSRTGYYAILLGKILKIKRWSP
jgi:hypothetical protein